MSAQTLLITGTSSGIGLHLTLCAAEMGHKVFAACRDPATAATNYPELEQLGGHWVKLDVNDDDSENIVSRICEEHNVDILINNAGYALLGALEDIRHVSISEFESLLQANTLGAVRCIKGALPHFRLRRSGTIVNVSSVAGFDGHAACTAYAASKFALEGMTEALAREVGCFGIRVLLVEPGAFRTNLVAKLRVPKSRNLAYKDTPADQVVRFQEEANGTQPGDPSKGARRIIEISTGIATTVPFEKGRGEALRIFLGKDCIEAAKQKNQKFSEDISLMEEVAASTEYE
ncbi:hypothetical protein F5884DRAFT_875321 [Xylogone sp. PMI_703]|nr:hypothetical protein F5884DRAFT_875321 [Xylogone sp. PMI_703]